MRTPVDRTRLDRFLTAFGRQATRPSTVYLVGGASAVLEGWRATTRDIDMHVDDEELLRSLPRLKEELAINVELASPLHFLPELPGWRDRSPFVRSEGRLTVRQFDFYSQALSKMERGFDQDIADVQAMVDRRLVDPHRLRELYAQVDDQIYRFPAVDAEHLRRALDALASGSATD